MTQETRENLVLMAKKATMGKERDVDFPNRMLQMRARGFAIGMHPDAMKGMITTERL